jgi:hypothetical protein
MRPAWLIFLFVFLGCRYHFTEPKGTMVDQIAQVWVPVFFNRTAEANLEIAFTNALREQLAQGAHFSNDTSEAVMTGTVMAVSASPFLGAPGLPPNSMARASVQIVLTVKGVSVKTVVLNGEEEFPPGPDILLTEQNRALALSRLAQKMMRDALEQFEE